MPPVRVAPIGVSEDTANANFLHNGPTQQRGRRLQLSRYRGVPFRPLTRLSFGGHSMATSARSPFRTEGRQFRLRGTITGVC